MQVCYPKTMKLRALTERERRGRERLRLVAAGLFIQGVRQAEVARLLEVSPQAVNPAHLAPT
jgi:DNA-binding CsgD family transcriptional regulator